MDLVLWALAVGGTALFILKMGMLLLGGHGFGEHDDGSGFADAHVGDQPGDAHGDHHSDSSKIAFQFFSLQAIAVFCMGVGWMGIAARSNGAAPQVVTGLGRALRRPARVPSREAHAEGPRAPESSGTVDVNRAVGQRGTVYLSIPRAGRGQVQSSSRSVS